MNSEQPGSVESGTVVYYFGTRGYGFIAPEQGERDIFFHIQNFETTESFNDSDITPGARVLFKRLNTRKGPAADCVRLVGA